MTPYSEAALLDAFETVEEIVGLGRYHDNEEAITRLLTLPDGLTPVGEGTLTLYRTYALGARDYASLVGSQLTITHPRVTSWTRSRLAARIILRTAARRRGTHRAVVLAAEIPRDHLLVDVPALYRRLRFDDESVESWDLYARWEREVLLRDQPPQTFTVADLHEVADPADPELDRPLAGERIWIASEQVMDTLASVSRRGSTCSDTPCWSVDTEEGRTGYAAYDGRHHSWTLTRRAP